MSIGTPPITNFTAGEWSPKLYGRIDLARYGQACSELVNMTIMPHGAVTRRMGTEFVAYAANAYTRLIPFVFSEKQAYMMEFSPGRVRFFRDGGYLEGKDLSTPWQEEDMWRFSYCQSADVMYVLSHDFAPRKIMRTGPDSFELAVVQFVGTPEEWGGSNWPRLATFHHQRLWIGGAARQPQKIWASRVGDFENFTSGSDEDSALSLSLVAEQVNAIYWMISQKDLIVGTAGGEWAITASGNAAITNKNIRIVRNSNYGTSTIRPLVAGPSILHASAEGRRLRELSYAFADDAFISQDISLMAEHMLRPVIHEIANCQNPDGIIWCRLGGGRFCGMTYLRSQEVTGWHRHETDGMVLSIACMPAEGHTETWMSVIRGGRVMIERMKAPWDGESTNEAGCWYVDCGLLYEGQATQKIFGLEHLEGQLVAVLADGAAHEPRSVQNGTIELDWPASRVLAGLPYTWAVAPMRLEGLSPRGTMQGKKTRINKLMARLYKSMGVHWSVPGQADAPYPLAARDVDMQMDAAPLPFTGDAEMAMPGGWTSDARVRLSGDGAFPATVIMLVPTAVVNE